MDDKIIYSWCFNFVECLDSTSSAASIILIKTLESMSSLRSHQYVGRRDIYICKKDGFVVKWKAEKCF